MDSFKQPKQSLRRKTTPATVFCTLIRRVTYAVAAVVRTHTYLSVCLQCTVHNRELHHLPRSRWEWGQERNGVHRELSGAHKPGSLRSAQVTRLWTSGDSLTNMQGQRWNGSINKENLQISSWVNPILILYRNTYQHNEKKKKYTAPRCRKRKICDQVPNCGCCSVSRGLRHAKCRRWRPGLQAWPSCTQPGDVTLLIVAASEHSPEPGTQEASLRSLMVCNPYFLCLFTKNSSWHQRVIPEELSAITLPPLCSRGTGVLL